MTPRLAALLLLALPVAAHGQPAAGPIAIGGQVESPASYTRDALAALPSVEVHAVREGGAPATFAGPLLWSLVEAAHPIDAPGRATRLQHVLLARGADGYAVALAIAEIDPGFEAKSVIIALAQDGAPLDHPRLVVPGDHRPGRAVRDLVAIDLN